jgi:hypothetical protein
VKKGKSIFICGLPASGKTNWILHSLLYFQSINRQAHFFKPFDIGEEKKRAKEQNSDRELLEKYSSFHSAIFNPYHFSQDFPLFFASNFDGFPINLKKVDNCYNKITTPESLSFVEILGGITQPLTDEVDLLDWLKGKTKKIIWIMSCEPKDFLWNFSELRVLQQFFDIYIILNNWRKNCDASWLKYLWTTMNKQKNCSVLGLIPPIKNSDKVHHSVQKIYQTHKKVLLNL